MIIVEPQGRSGGLALLWKEKEHANLLSLSQNHIDVGVSVEGLGEWRLTGFYGEPDRTNEGKHGIFYEIYRETQIFCGVQSAI